MFSRSRLVWLEILLLATTLAACGGSPTPASTPLPVSPDQAVKQLAKHHREAFETWKNSPFKRCDPSEAFGIAEEAAKTRGPTHVPMDSLGIDLARLLASNGQSLAVRGTAGEFALLGASLDYGGSATAKLKHSQHAKSQHYQLEAEFRRDGSHCTAFLWGQKVHETRIVQSIAVDAFWEPSAVAGGVRAAYAPKKAGSLTELPKHGLAYAVWNALLPTEKAQDFLARRFALPEEAARGMFHLAATSLLGHAIQPTANPAALWFSTLNPRLVAPDAFFTAKFGAGPSQIELRWKLKPQAIDVAGAQNTADAGNWNLRSVIDVAPVAGSAPAEFEYTARTIEFGAPTAFDPTEATRCLKDRALTLHALDAGRTTDAVAPTLVEAAEPCRALAGDVDQLADRDGTYAALLPALLRGLAPSPRVKYEDWADVIVRAALPLAEKGEDVAAKLDPAGVAPVLQNVAANLKPLVAEVPRLGNAADLRTPLFRMAIAWGMSGQKVTADRASRIAQAVDHASPELQVSVSRLIQDLSTKADSNDPALTFAESVDAPYKTEARRAWALATALGDTSWVRGVYDLILQKRTPLDELRATSERYTRIQSALDAYVNLKPVRGTLARASVQWLVAGELKPEDLPSVYAALSNVIDAFPESTQTLLGALTTSYAKQKDAVEYARSLTAEYKALATGARDAATAQGLADWAKEQMQTMLQKRPPIDTLHAWKDALDAGAAFRTRENQRTQGDFMASTNDGYRRDLLKVALREGWGADEFTALESITQLGRAKTACSHYKGASSVANCLGLASFGKGEDRLFDPKFDRRYGPLANDFAGYLSRLVPEFSYFATRTRLLGEFFGSSAPVWSKCKAGPFADKARQLRAGIDELVKASDAAKFAVERTIVKTLENCD